MVVVVVAMATAAVAVAVLHRRCSFPRLTSTGCPSNQTRCTSNRSASKQRTWTMPCRAHSRRWHSRLHSSDTLQAYPTGCGCRSCCGQLYTGWAVEASVVTLARDHSKPRFQLAELCTRVHRASSGQNDNQLALFSSFVVCVGISAHLNFPPYSTGRTCSESMQPPSASPSSAR